MFTSFQENVFHINAMKSVPNIGSSFTGDARITLDGDSFEMSAGDSIDIEIGVAHRIENIGADELIFTEVQTGTYFGEDDIERLEDDFGRS
jgi:mannose-6-phosphate isomerase